MTEEEVNERGKYLCDKCKEDGPNFPLCPNLPIKMLPDSFDSEISEFSHSSFRKKPIIHKNSFIYRIRCWNWFTFSSKIPQKEKFSFNYWRIWWGKRKELRKVLEMPRKIKEGKNWREIRKEKK
jgi:hypothetical protein